MIPELARAMPGTAAELARVINKNYSNVHRALKGIPKENYTKKDGVYTWKGDLPNQPVGHKEPWVKNFENNWDQAEINSELTDDEIMTKELAYDKVVAAIKVAKYMEEMTNRAPSPSN